MTKRINRNEIDYNILKALKRLKWPLFNYENNSVIVRLNARNETGFEHIANKRHLIKVRDIDALPQVLKKPYKLIISGKKENGKSYYGKRTIGEKFPYLKIVTRKLNSKQEQIVTIYTTKIIK